jgi:uncharacterized protein YecT (DUF1311 family)
MPDVDLSTLAAPELRRLLDAARGRGQATLSYQILQEMEARRDRGARARLPGRKRAEPRVIDLNLGDDPLDRWEDPLEAAEPDVEPKAAAEPEPVAALYLERDPPPPVAPPRRSRWIGLGLIIGVAVGVPLGLGMGRIIPEPVSPLMVPTESAVSVVAPAAQPPVAVPPALPPPSAPIPADPPTAADTPPANALPPPPVEVAATTPPPAAPIEEAKEDTTAPPTAAKGCASSATPADRAICADPDLQRLQRELRDAYAQALDAHEDRTLLRQRQLAWRAERDSVSDPDKLAQLYEQRIRKLKAATADAKHQH